MVALPHTALPSTLLNNYVRADWPHNNHADACDELTHRGKTVLILGASSLCSLAETALLGTLWVVRKATCSDRGFLEEDIGHVEYAMYRSFQINLVNSLVGQVQNIFLQRVLQ